MPYCKQDVTEELLPHGVLGGKVCLTLEVRHGRQPDAFGLKGSTFQILLRHRNRGVDNRFLVVQRKQLLAPGAWTRRVSG